METCKTEARVYDIVNAGPRHAYTAGGNKVHNCGHGWNYRAGAKTIAKASGQPLEVAEKFVTGMNAAFAKLVAWQKRTTSEGEEYGKVVNSWGRPLPVDRQRAYNQSPAQYGQSGTREILADGLIRMMQRDWRLMHWVILSVHDALVFDIPEEELDWAVPCIVECMEMDFHPEGGQLIHFPVDHGEPSDNWEKAGH